MWINIIVLIVAFIILIKASDIFIDAASSIAINFKVPKMVIALTVASFGTCAPELAVSFNSIFSNNGDVAIANVLGSNIVNILLIIGITAIFFPIKIKNETVKRPLPILLLITSFFSVSVIGSLLLKVKYILAWYEALMLILLFLIFIIYISKLGKKKIMIFENQSPKYTLIKSIIYTVLCLIVIIISSDIVVNKAVLIAKQLSISQKIISMTIIVIGTSLPELVTTIAASKKKEYDLAVGNIIGSNIFNLGIVLGLPVLVKGGVTSTSFNIVDIFMIEFAAIILFVFAKKSKVLSRREGILMIIAFIVYYVAMIFFL